MLKPGILYPLTTDQCTAKDQSPIQQIIDWEILHSQNLSTHFPHDVLCSPLEYGGLGIVSLHSENLLESHLLHPAHSLGSAISFGAPLVIYNLKLGLVTMSFKLDMMTLTF